MKKLVRDKIIEIIQSSGRKVVFIELKPKGFFNQKDENKNQLMLFKYLNKKLNEEWAEFIKAKKREDIIEEIADVLEVMDTMNMNGIHCSNTRDFVKFYKKIKKNENNKLVSHQQENYSLTFPILYFKMKENQILMEDVLKTKKIKLKKNGGFKNGIILLKIIQ